MNQFPGSGIYDRQHAVQDMSASQGRYTGPQAESRYVIPRFVERTSRASASTTRTRSSSRSA